MKKFYSLILGFMLMLNLVTPAFAASAQKLTDIKARDYFYDAAMWAANNSIIPGISKNKFQPSKKCTNAQVITALWRAMGKPAAKSKKNPFTDVKKSDSFYKPVLWAVEKGILSDTSKSRFYPSKKCTEAKTITFLWRAMGKPSASAKGTVAKGYSKKKYYKTAVAWADRSGLLKLRSKTFNPGAASTRADLAVYLYLILDKDVKTANEALADMSGWGVNIADIFSETEPDFDHPHDDIGYTTERPITGEFGLSLTYWDGSSEWIASPGTHEGSFTASAAIPDYDDSKPWADWMDSMFLPEFFTNVQNGQTKIQLKNSRIVLADGSQIKLSALDGKYSITNSKDADSYGWYSAALEFYRSRLPKPDKKFNGARIETTLVSDLSFKTPEDKADYYICLGHGMKYDPKKAADVFLREGTNVVRLPVSWTPFVDDKTFKIDKVWLEKVAEEIDYILQNNAYCILDLHADYTGKSFVGDHWDTRWMDAQYKDYVDRRFAAVWKQIAEYFKNYPRKLMFETCNEPGAFGYDDSELQHPRVNELNELFVKTVRATGGKNKNRILSVVAAKFCYPGTLENMTPPQDDHLIMQVHCYGEMEAQNSKAATDQIFAYIDAFTNRTGIPVIIGETGVSYLEPEEAHLSDITYFFKQARQRGIPALWWEDFYELTEYEDGTPENYDHVYWLYDKVNNKWKRPKILKTIKDATK